MYASAPLHMSNSFESNVIVYNNKIRVYTIASICDIAAAVVATVVAILVSDLMLL